MTKEQAKQHLAQNALLMFEHNGTSTLDGDATLELIDKIYDDFEDELQNAYKQGIKDEARCHQPKDNQ